MNASILFPILQQMLIDIQNPACHYWVYTNYFDIQPPTNQATPSREVTRWWQAPLFLDYDSVWNAELTEDGG